MKKFQFYIRPILLFTVFFLSISCGGSDDGPDPDPIPDPVPEPRTSQDVIDDFNALTINVGTNDLKLESLIEGEFWNFRIIVPEGSSSSNKRPLVLNLHGAARANSTTAHQSTACLVEPAFEGKDVFILSPNSNGFDWYDQTNIVQVLALVDLVTTNLNVDENRNVVTGYSDGGNGSWFFADYYENLFDAAIPLASSYDVRATSDGGEIKVPLYVIHGSADEHFPLEETELFVSLSKEAGSDITFVVADGLIHTAPCDYLPYFKDAVSWLEQEVW